VPGATLVQHRHCASCGKAIVPSRTTCQGDCEERHARVQKSRKRFWRLWFIATLSVVAIYFLLANV
jgi:predicted nucleic acid-binding Zn ribbon protein